MKLPLAIALTMALAPSMSDDFGDDYSPRMRRDPKPRDIKYPFTEEEREHLATLSGKDKKQYLKGLKAKYRSYK